MCVVSGVISGALWGNLGVICGMISVVIWGGFVGVIWHDLWMICGVIWGGVG